MQLSTFDTLKQWDFTDKNVLIGLSGGINSMAVLCYLNKFIESKPKELHLVYCDFKEHSPGTLDFVYAGIEYAKKNFDNVFPFITNNSVLQFFDESNMIPAPAFSPCTRILKVLPIAEYMANHHINVDLVGYVREEDRRIINQIGRKLGMGKMSRKKLIGISELIISYDQSRNQNHRNVFKKKLILLGVKDIDKARILVESYHNKVSEDGQKAYVISHISDEDCFSLVKQEIGWYPAIYDLKFNDDRLPAFFEQNKDLLIDEQRIRLRNKIGSNERIFKHNNCLPCKNMQSWEFLMVKLFYPEFYINAIKLQDKLPKSEWGREADSVISAELACSFCTFD